MKTDFTPEYEIKTDEELMHLAKGADSLLPEARSALVRELRKRKLDTSDQSSRFDEERRYYKHLDDTNLGNLTLIVPHGIGRRAYGKTNRETIGVTEQYDATVFAVVFYFPLVPLGTYRFSREQGSKWFRVLDKKRLNWGQIFVVWLKAFAVIASIGLLMDLILR